MASPHRVLPPLELLRGFEAAARHLSFTRAAEELFLTQSAVSRQIQGLEEFLGVPLFERRHKALALTEAGEAYQRAVSSALGDLREATKRLREARRKQEILTVTTTISFASTWLIPRLNRFRKERPRTDVRITATHQVMDLEREGIDLAIRDCRIDQAPPGSIYLVGENIAPVASPQYLREARAAKRPLARPEDLRHHVLIHFQGPGGRYPWLGWAAWFESRKVEDIEPAGSLTFDQYDQALQAALHGHGVALGRMTMVEQYIRRKQLTALFGRPQDVGRAFHAVYARGAHARPEARQFVDWLQRELREGT